MAVYAGILVCLDFMVWESALVEAASSGRDRKLSFKTERLAAVGGSLKKRSYDS